MLRFYPLVSNFTVEPVLPLVQKLIFCVRFAQLVIPSHWFRAKRAAAVGIVVAGSSLGGIIFPIMLSNLFDRIGFAWSVRAMALVMFVVQAISIPLIKERLPPLKNKKYFDFAALKEIPFLLHCLSGFFSAFGENSVSLGPPPIVTQR